MGYTNVASKDKIMEMYTEIEKFKLAVSLDFDKEKNAYIVKFEERRQGTHDPP